VTGPRTTRHVETQIVEGSPVEPTIATVVADLLRRGVPVQFHATGASMAPAILDGDTITVEPVDAERLRRGDVVLALRGSAVVAHRLVRRARRRDSESELVLRGDAADGDDAPVPAIDVLGRVVEIERAGVRHRPSSLAARLTALGRLLASRLLR
jgi:hypothetical protein